MLKFVNYNVVFQEVPNETTLAINLSRCPNGCVGCHSSDLQKDIGEVLNEEVILELLQKYQHSITCICFMGGDNNPKMVEQLSAFIQRITLHQIKTAWYSGRSQLPENILIDHFNYIKLGPYIEKLGALDAATSNQRFYEIVNNKMLNKTHLFTQKKALVAEY
ncbi:MAG: anaerobic ribonucleoside-triphosphate reductase activating protein [Bacteroidales bacterium]|jgi:anaerobic ribonucleoside-triphosphate reductase activating protein|nr:anaerobic ribonucleoside-triphosphate reductase activating protein [Bacteroidales bacterium]